MSSWNDPTHRGQQSVAGAAWLSPVHCQFPGNCGPELGHSEVQWHKSPGLELLPPFLAMLLELVAVGIVDMEELPRNCIVPSRSTNTAQTAFVWRKRIATPASFVHAVSNNFCHTAGQHAARSLTNPHLSGLTIDGIAVLQGTYGMFNCMVVMSAYHPEVVLCKL